MLKVSNIQLKTKRRKEETASSSFSLGTDSSTYYSSTTTTTLHTSSWTFSCSNKNFGLHISPNTN